MKYIRALQMKRDVKYMKRHCAYCGELQNYEKTNLVYCCHKHRTPLSLQDKLPENYQHTCWYCKDSDCQAQDRARHEVVCDRQIKREIERERERKRDAYFKTYHGGYYESYHVG